MKQIIIKANFELDEMVEMDVERAVKHIAISEPNTNIRKSSRLIRTVLSDFGLENVRIYIRETENNIHVNLEKAKSYYDLKEGDKVNFRGEKCKVDKVYDMIPQLRIIYRNQKVLVGKEDVEVI